MRNMKGFPLYSMILFFLQSFLLISCSSDSSTSITNLGNTNAGFYSNTPFSPTDIQSKALYSLNSSSLNDIRAVGGEIYQSGNFVTIVIPADALFEPNTSLLLLHADKLISDVATMIAGFPGEDVIITAHTDNMGPPFSQAKLSQAQAHLFALTLWQQDDIDLSTFQRFKYAGMGNTQTVTDDSSPRGQALNRRIQITIFPSKEMKEAYQNLGNPDLHPI